MSRSSNTWTQTHVSDPNHAFVGDDAARNKALSLMCHGWTPELPIDLG